jgi:hypothetical protein
VRSAGALEREQPVDERQARLKAWPLPREPGAATKVRAAVDSTARLGERVVGLRDRVAVDARASSRMVGRRADLEAPIDLARSGRDLPVDRPLVASAVALEGDPHDGRD